MNNKFLRNLICYMQIVCIVALSLACLCIGGLAEEELILSAEQWAAESQTIMQKASPELLQKLEESGQGMPEYVSGIDECKDENRLYILPDGHVYVYHVRPGDSQFKNELMYATDENGELYNNGLGYKEKVRYSTTTQEEVYDAGWEVTGYIPVSAGDVLRMRNVEFFSDEEDPRAKFVFFDYKYRYLSCSKNFTHIGGMADAWAATADKDGQLVEWIIPKRYYEDVYYMRIIAKDFSLDSMLTVNHMIPETEGVGGWFRFENLMLDESVFAETEDMELDEMISVEDEGLLG